MKTNGQHEVIARIAGTGWVLATLLALVLASSIAGRAQSSAASPAVPAAAPATPAKASPAAQAGQPTAPPSGSLGETTRASRWVATGSSRSGTPTASLSPTRSLRTACN